MFCASRRLRFEDNKENYVTRKVSGLLRNRPQISINDLGLFISLLIAILP